MDSAAVLPIRIFQIVDQLNGTPLFTWPQQKSSVNGALVDLAQSVAKEMALKEFKSSSYDNQQQEDISCTRHFYASTKAEYLQEICLFQKILIPYGNVIFESFQVSPDTVKLTTSAICSPQYQHYFMNPAVTNVDASSGNSALTPLSYDLVGNSSHYTTDAAIGSSYHSHSELGATAESLMKGNRKSFSIINLYA